VVKDPQGVQGGGAVLEGGVPQNLASLNPLGCRRRNCSGSLQCSWLAIWCVQFSDSVHLGGGGGICPRPPGGRIVAWPVLGGSFLVYLCKSPLIRW